LRELSTGHEVACHFAEEVVGSREQLQSTGRGGAAAAVPAGGAEAAAQLPVSVPAATAPGDGHESEALPAMTAVVDDPLIRGDAPVYEIPVVADRGMTLDMPVGDDAGDPPHTPGLA
ncbi:MAG: hypothetical protein QG587_608, partial [Chloroflexota bacterium]|nr:hypothetical protein [Chloroflexota bacterium]